jgi:dolichol-phosphate mannosyltransferase
MCPSPRLASTRAHSSRCYNPRFARPRRSPLSSSRTLVVVPTYNERDNVGPLIDGLLACGDQIDVRVADDGSPDGTAEAVREAMARHPGRVDLLLRSGKGGRGAAVIAAFKQGLADPRRYRYLFEMDADFSHHPSDLPKFLDRLRSCDMVIGSRYIPGGGTSDWGVVRPLLSWLANKYIGAVAGIPVRDTTSGYRGYRREVLEATDFDRIKITGYVVHGEMAYQAWLNGFRLGEVPIHFRNRRRAASKLTGEEIYMALVNFALLRRRYGTVPRRREEPRAETS